MTEPLDLEPIKARLAPLTTDNWHSDDLRVSADDLDDVADLHAERDGVCTLIARDMRNADAEFCALARTDIPALIAEVERLRSELDAANADLNREMLAGQRAAEKIAKLQEALRPFAEASKFVDPKDDGVFVTIGAKRLYGSHLHRAATLLLPEKSS